MAQNITIAGASYSAVPSIQVPKTGSGTATFMDTSDANAGASDIMSGKTAYVNGTKVTGTASGGLEYETGTWSPSTTSTTRPTINFSGTHSEPPAIVAMHYNATSIATDVTVTFVLADLSRLVSSFTKPTGTWYDGICRYTYAGSSSENNGSGTFIRYGGDNTGSTDTSYFRYYATDTYFKPYSNGKKWSSSSSYTWVAIWAPTT